MAAWIKTDSGGVIIAKTNGMDNPGPKTLFINKHPVWGRGTLNFDVGWEGYVESSRMLDDNVWHHVAVTAAYDGDYIVGLYIDGEPDGLEYLAIDQYAETDYRLKIGFDGREVHEFPGFYGQIDEVSIWDRPLSKKKIQAIMKAPLVGTEPGLMGYWPFNEKTGNLCDDMSAHNNTGTFVGNPARDISNVPLLNSKFRIPNL